jgi:hypothetical protein
MRRQQRIELILRQRSRRVVMSCSKRANHAPSRNAHRGRGHGPPRSASSITLMVRQPNLVSIDLGSKDV